MDQSRYNSDHNNGNTHARSVVFTSIVA
jgi:hypothetical protein